MSATLAIIIGLILVIIAGIGSGTGAWVFKVKKEMCFEQFLMPYAIVSMILIPWIFTLTNFNVCEMLKYPGMTKSLLWANFFSFGWGAANILYFICVIKIGAVLTGAILSALGMSITMMLPMLYHIPGWDAPNQMALPYVFAALVILILAVILSSIAGAGRDKQLRGADAEQKKKQAAGDIVQGLILVVIAGVLSAGMTLSFNFGQGTILKAVEAQGINPDSLTGTFAVWALAIFSGAILHVIYAAFLLSKNKTWGNFFNPRCQTETFLGVILGFQWFATLTCVGKGMLFLGALGPSIGSGIQQAVQTLGNQFVGFVSGEWKGVKGSPRSTIYTAILLLLIAIVIMAFTNYKFSEKTTVPTEPVAVATENSGEPIAQETSTEEAAANATAEAATAEAAPAEAAPAEAAPAEAAPAEAAPAEAAPAEAAPAEAATEEPVLTL